MSRQLNSQEAYLKREITKIYKKNVGRGPKKTTVRIVDHLVSVRLEEALSNIEIKLLRTERGRKLVKEIRDELVYGQSLEYVTLIEKYLDTKVEGVSYAYGEVSNVLYLFLICENNIENGYTEDTREIKTSELVEST